MSLSTTSPGPWRIYLGTYTRESGSRGIHAALLDAGTGALSVASPAAETPDPSFVATGRRDRILYATGEFDHTLRIFQRAPDDTLVPLEVRPSGGDFPCHVATHASGRLVAVANYGGSVSAFPIQISGATSGPAQIFRHEGKGPHPRQDTAHPHGVTFSPDGRHLLVPDLGLDEVRVYVVDVGNGRITAHPAADFRAPPGSGPRHLAFSISGRNAYLINELSNTLIVADYSANAARLTPRQVISPIPPFAGESWSAEVLVHPTDRWIFTSHRGPDCIAVLARDSATGELTTRHAVKSGGRWPRHMALSPDGTWLLVAHERSDDVVVFRVDVATGVLTATGHRLAVGRPVCVTFAP